MAGPWFVRSAAAGTADGLSWTNAKLTLAAAATASSAGDTFWVADDHAETQASDMTIAFPGTSANPNFVYCADHLVASPGTGDLKVTATITTTGAFSISVTGCLAECYGIIFSAGTGASGGRLTQSGAPDGQRYNSCAFRLGSTGSFQFIVPGNSSQSSLTEWINCTVQFGNVGQKIAGYGSFTWRQTPSAITGATLPTLLFDASFSGTPGNILVEGVDLSALGSGQTLVGGGVGLGGPVVFKDCKLGSSVVVQATPTEVTAPRVDIIRSDSASTNYRVERYRFTGTQLAETVIVRTGGASDGTSVSRRITTTANSKWAWPFEAIPIGIWNTVTAANVTVTLESIWNAAALPNNDDIWVEVTYQGSATSPLGSLVTQSKANNLASGTALSASTAAWDSLVLARANSTAYSVGDVRKVASNPGRIFFCTTAGTSAGSEPAGYASAVDGGSVTDNTAVFRAGVRFKLTATLTGPQPQKQGYVYATVKAAKVSSTFWIDPFVVLS